MERKSPLNYSPSNACRGEGRCTSTTDMQDRGLPADPELFSHIAAVLTSVPRPQACTQFCNMSQSFCCLCLLPWSSSDKSSLSRGMTSNYTAWLLLASFLLQLGETQAHFSVTHASYTPFSGGPRLVCSSILKCYFPNNTVNID